MEWWEDSESGNTDLSLHLSKLFTLIFLQLLFTLISLL